MEVFPSNLLWRLLSTATYIASMYFQSNILVRVSGDTTVRLASAMFLTFAMFATNAVLCHSGKTCLRKGVTVNATLFFLSACGILSSLLTLHGQMISNALTRVLIKSGKVVPTCAIESIYLSKWPSSKKACGCLTLLGGTWLILSTMGGEGSTSSSRTLGIALLALGAFLDSGMACAEEQFFFHPEQGNLTVQEVAFGCSFYGAVTLGVLATLPAALEPLTMTMGTVHLPTLALFCILSALSFLSHFVVVSDDGALYADAFKSFRKVVAIVFFGMVVQSSPPNMTAVVAFTMCAAGTYLIDTVKTGIFKEERKNEAESELKGLP